MRSYWIDVNPAVAETLLATNTNPRLIKSSVVEMYARDMMNGRWHDTHQGIALDTHGRLLDGFHRLNAVILSGCTIKFWLTEDVPLESVGVFDTGRQRSMADRLQVEGYRDAPQLAAITRRAMLWNENHIWSRSPAPTREDISAAIKSDPRLVEAAKYAHTWSGNKILAPAIAGLAFWLLEPLSPEEAITFLEGVRLGIGPALERLNPAWALRERLIADKLGRSSAGRYARGNIRVEVNLALVIIAWNHFRQHNQLHRLQLPVTITDANFPQPV